MTGQLRALRQAVAMLKAAYPDRMMGEQTEAVWLKSLSDFSGDEVRDAVNVAVASEVRMPSIARVREIVFERRLNLADPHQAWERVTAFVHFRGKTVKCIACAGFGTATGGEDVCPTCRGNGEVQDASDRPVLTEVERRALDFVGGRHEARSSDRPAVVRAQFLKAYEQFRSEEIRVANLTSLGVLEAPARRLALASGE